MKQFPHILDLGCGNDKLPNAIGMDINPHGLADVIHDLDDVPWPFEDSTFDHVRAQDVLEHVNDFIKVVEEIYRICRNKSVVEVRMPFMASTNFATDPTHRRAGTHRTFDYFDPNKPLGKYHYSKARFRLLQFHYLRGYVNNHVGRSLQRLDTYLLPYIETMAETYELYFAYLYPMHDVYYRLQVEK